MTKKYFIITLIIASLTSSAFSNELYKSKVTASFYAEDFNGKKTSNGETFNMNSLTCAHKYLPFNTVLKVTNLANGKTVNVRVNDRGPFVPDREIDLSKAAAIQLGMVKTGTTSVKLEIVERGPDTKASRQTAQKAKEIMEQRFPGSTSSEKKSTAKKTKNAAGTSAKKSNSASEKPAAEKPVNTTGNKAPVITLQEPGSIWDIQVGAYSSKDNASRVAQQLLHNGISNVVYQTSKSTGIVRVVIKDVSAENLPKIENSLQNLGYFDYTLKRK